MNIKSNTIIWSVFCYSLIKISNIIEIKNVWADILFISIFYPFIILYVYFIQKKFITLKKYFISYLIFAFIYIGLELLYNRVILINDYYYNYEGLFIKLLLSMVLITFIYSILHYTRTIVFSDATK